MSCKRTRWPRGSAEDEETEKDEEAARAEEGEEECDEGEDERVAVDENGSANDAKDLSCSRPSLRRSAVTAANPILPDSSPVAPSSFARLCLLSAADAGGRGRDEGRDEGREEGGAASLEEERGREGKDGAAGGEEEGKREEAEETEEEGEGEAAGGTD